MTAQIQPQSLNINTLIVALLASLLWAGHAKAHLMVEQTGVLNIVGDDVFMALSIPVSALENVDQDDDQEVSLFEFNSRRNEIIAQIQTAIALETESVSADLHDLRLVPVRPHGHDSVYVSQVIVMGRFTLTGSIDALNFRLALFGKSPNERSMKITAKHPHSDTESVVVLTPSAPNGTLFASTVAQQSQASGRP
ncbi:hypothetical protein R0135_13765 [Congregibacter variabilis]|uniref:Uncharacterized protein n=1 Tax=Congregibacter variabilis TaxID=3081200 RepID=A0ABZ0I003_9GAMM|nr:hypothetical protein R0135_13765 [Congregibacter sp. IMCC43200]